MESKHPEFLVIFMIDNDDDDDDDGDDDDDDDDCYISGYISDMSIYKCIYCIYMYIHTYTVWWFGRPLSIHWE